MCISKQNKQTQHRLYDACRLYWVGQNKTQCDAIIYERNYTASYKNKTQLLMSGNEDRSGFCNEMLQ